MLCQIRCFCKGKWAHLDRVTTSSRNIVRKKHFRKGEQFCERPRNRFAHPALAFNALVEFVYFNKKEYEYPFE
eukprot:UN22396